MTEGQKIFVGNIKKMVDYFATLFEDASNTEKIEMAEELQKSVDWVRFRAGANKECFNCRLQNDPRALVCVACHAEFICESCWQKFGEKKMAPWRCAHAAGFNRPAIMRMAVRTRDEAQEEKAIVMPKFSFGDEE